jgi:hypothetical protein
VPSTLIERQPEPTTASLDARSAKSAHCWLRPDHLIKGHSGQFREFKQNKEYMPSLPLPVSHGQRHPRYGHRLLKTGPANRKEQIEPFHVWAERWLVYLRRYKYAMIGVASAAIAVYCPPSPFSSARERHQHLGTHYPTTFSTTHSRCSFSSIKSSREVSRISNRFHELIFDEFPNYSHPPSNKILNLHIGH